MLSAPQTRADGSLRAARCVEIDRHSGDACGALLDTHGQPWDKERRIAAAKAHALRAHGKRTTRFMPWWP